MKTAVALLICFSVSGFTTHLSAQESPSPYAEVFPRTLPSLKVPKIELTRNEKGLPVRYGKSHEQAAAKVKEYLQTQYLPKVRERDPGQDATSIRIVTRPTTESLEVHENLVYTRWGDHAMVLDLYLGSWCLDLKTSRVAASRKGSDRPPLQHGPALPDTMGWQHDGT